MTYTNESYQSTPNSDFLRIITPADIFYLQQHEILITSGVSDVNYLCKTDDFPPNRVFDDNLMMFDVQSDCTGVKMCDNTFSGGFKLYCVAIEGVRDKKTKKSVLQSCKTRFTKILKK